MDANMSAFKRRFNKAMLGLGNSQASCAARRLVGQTIQAMEKHRTISSIQRHSKPKSSSASSSSSNSNSNRRPNYHNTTQVSQQQQQRHFWYTFAPHSNHHNKPSPDFLASGQIASNSSCDDKFESGQDHGRTRRPTEAAKAVSYRQYYDELNYQDDERVDYKRRSRQEEEEEEDTITGWSLVSELRTRRERINQEEDDDDDYFDVEYLARKEKVETMLPNDENHQEESLTTSLNMSQEEDSLSLSTRREMLGSPETTISSTDEKQTQKTSFSRSHMGRSSVRSLRRRSAKFRQVRFQPIPQSIDISIQSEEDSSLREESTTTTEEIKSLGKKLSFKPKHLKRKVTRKLNSNLSHMNAQFNKMITLKGFNSLAHRFHQTINNHHHHHSTSQFHFAPSPKDSQTITISSHTKRDEDSRYDHSYDDNNVAAAAAEEDDIGWGSDFDDQSADSSLTIVANQAQTDQHQQQSGYLLEIGKASQDTKAIQDVIHGQGISGQFKRLDTSATHEPPELAFNDKDGQELVAVAMSSGRHLHDDGLSLSPISGGGGDASQISSNNEDEDEEAELRSLEGRQGFKHIRDKLKIIFDQRLMAEHNLAGSSQKNVVASSSQARHSVANISSTPTATSLSSVVSSSAQSHNRFALTTTTTRQSEDDDESGEEEMPKLVVDRPNVVVVVAASAASVNSESCCGQLLNETPKGSKQQQLASSSSGNSSEFDCQSHCSDDSNHSGSQDSGHSTQHSAYSSACSSTSASSSTTNSTSQLMNHRHLCGPCVVVVGREQEQEEARQLQSIEPPPINSVAAAATSTGCEKTNDDDDEGQNNSQVNEEEEEDSRERRSRFMQNRLIINNKLESMFRSRSGGGGGLIEPTPPGATITLTKADRRVVVEPTTTTTTTGTTQSALSSPPKLQSKATPEKITRCVVDDKPTTTTEIILPNMMRTETTTMLMSRQQLLEQQRQMSLKLKQKPRRKAANHKWIWMNNSPNNNLNNHQLTTSQNNVHQQNDIDGQQQQAKESQNIRMDDSSYSPARPALSLRQLVKDVIDNYERLPTCHFDS